MASRAIRASLFARNVQREAAPRTTFACRHTAAASPVRAFSITRPAYLKKYTEDHEWIELSPDNKIGTIGISQYAAKALGDVVYVELPSVDQDVEAGGAIGAVESVKSASDIMTPISGKVVEINEVLSEKASTINQSPESDGWIAKIEVSDTAQVNALMDADQYKKFTEEAEEKH